MISNEELIRLALTAREQAYCPYSGYSVGTALLTREGKVFCGCNIENAALSPGLCAERCAMAAAIAAGCRDFVRLAVVGGRAGQPVSAFFWPCGVCRQWLAEFCSPDFPLLCAISPEQYQEASLSQLLPHGFGPADMK